MLEINELKHFFYRREYSVIRKPRINVRGFGSVRPVLVAYSWKENRVVSVVDSVNDVPKCMVFSDEVYLVLLGEERLNGLKYPVGVLRVVPSGRGFRVLVERGCGVLEPDFRARRNVVRMFVFSGRC